MDHLSPARHPRDAIDDNSLNQRSGWVPSTLRNARWVSRCALMLPGRYFTDSGNLAVPKHSYSPVEVHASECVACDRHRYFRANSLNRHTSGWVPYRLRNARWVSKFDVLPADGTFTRILNTWHLRNSHSPVEVHVSECVACGQHRYFRANSSKNTHRDGSLLALGTCGSCRNLMCCSLMRHLHGF